MKTLLVFVLALSLLLAASCIEHTEAKSTSGNATISEKYTGPIIDMHVHAYNRKTPMFGLENFNPLTRKTYIGSENTSKASGRDL